MITATNHELHVDMLSCDAYGYCAELLPEIVELDQWGYPIVTGDVGPDRLEETRDAVVACPKLALRLAPAGGPGGTAPSRFGGSRSGSGYVPRRAP
jgi:ferredoxin